MDYADFTLKMINMTRIIERNVAEILVLMVFLAVLMSSCATTHSQCAAYASVEVENNNN